MALTVADAIYQIAEVVANGVALDDERIMPRINDATQRLMAEGIWVGMVADVLVCTLTQYFTLPRILESAIDFYLPDSRLDTPNGWYSVENPATYVDPDSLNDIVLVDLGEVPTILDVCGGQTLTVYSLVAEPNAFIRIFGFDQNNKEIYSTQNGVYAKGVLIPLTVAGSQTTQQFNQITGIQKPLTNGPVLIYATNTQTNNQVLISWLDPIDTNPTYRRYFCNDIPINSDNSPVTVKVTGKRRFIPVTQPTDILLIQNISALKLEVLAIERQLSTDPMGAEVLHKQAVEMLKTQAKNYQLDPSRTTTRKAQLLADEQSYSHPQLGHVRARIALELPNMLKVGTRTITRLVNEAQERLISQGHWMATVGEFNLQIYETGYIVLPPMAESILTCHIGKHPLIIRNQWFEAAQSGPGRTDAYSYSGISLVDRGYGPTFFDLGITSQISVTSSATEAAGTTIQITGLDQDGNPVVEAVSIGGSSQNNFSKITNLLKVVTNGYIALQSVDHQVLAILQPTDLSPTFRRFFIPGLGSNFDPQTVARCQLKLKSAWVHMPADFLVIQDFPAIKTMVQALVMENAPDPQLDKALTLEKKAIQILNDSLKNSRGGAAPQLNVQVRGYGPGIVRQRR